MQPRLDRHAAGIAVGIGQGAIEPFQGISETEPHAGAVVAPHLDRHDAPGLVADVQAGRLEAFERNWRHGK